MTHEELSSSVSSAIAWLGAQSAIDIYAPIGSAAYLLSKDCNDVDFVALLHKPITPAAFSVPLTLQGGWTSCSAYDIPVGPWTALRCGNLNLIVTSSRAFYDGYVLATEVCKVLQLTDKKQRIAVCKVVRDGLPADFVRMQLEGLKL